jgi:hypothetical protein
MDPTLRIMKKFNQMGTTNQEIENLNRKIVKDLNDYYEKEKAKETDNKPVIDHISNNL